MQKLLTIVNTDNSCLNIFIYGTLVGVCIRKKYIYRGFALMKRFKNAEEGVGAEGRAGSGETTGEDEAGDRGGGGSLVAEASEKVAVVVKSEKLEI